MSLIIDQETLDVLQSLTIDAERYLISISEHLDRPLYLKVADVLDRIGGKWDTKTKAHRFAFSPAPALLDIIDTKELPPKNPTAFFPTPPDLIDTMMTYAGVMFGDLEIADTCRHLRILEPSAGHGAIARRVKDAFPNATLHTVESLSSNQAVLEAEGFAPHRGDFLAYNTDADTSIEYDLILMNPPFSYQGHPKAYIEHYLHALTMLSPEGRIIGIAPTGFIRNSTKQERAFYDLASANLDLEIIDKGAFHGSGTDIETCIFSISRPDSRIDSRSHLGYASMTSYNLFLSITNENESDLAFTRILERSGNDGHLDRYAMSAFITTFIQDHKREHVFFPIESHMDEYLNEADRWYMMDYDSSSAYRDDGLIQTPKTITQLKAETPSLFELVS